MVLNLLMIARMPAAVAPPRFVPRLQETVRTVLAEAVEQEQMEVWIMDEVGHSAALPGLYPIAETKARYEAAKKDNA